MWVPHTWAHWIYLLMIKQNQNSAICREIFTCAKTAWTNQTESQTHRNGTSFTGSTAFRVFKHLMCPKHARSVNSFSTCHCSSCVYCDLCPVVFNLVSCFTRSHISANAASCLVGKHLLTQLLGVWALPHFLKFWRTNPSVGQDSWFVAYTFANLPSNCVKLKTFV